MSGNSSVGTGGVYEAGDQRNPPDTEKPEAHPHPVRNEEGKENSHQANDSKDQRSIGNRLNAAEPQNDDISGKDKTAEQIAGEDDPTAPAKMHGNEPSRGAKIDKSIQDEEEELIRKMDEKKAQKKGN